MRPRRQEEYQDVFEGLRWFLALFCHSKQSFLRFFRELLVIVYWILFSWVSIILYIRDYISKFSLLSILKILYLYTIYYILYLDRKKKVENLLDSLIQKEEVALKQE